MLHVSRDCTPRELLWHNAMKARMNVRYYQLLIRRSERVDFAVRAAAALIASGGIAVAVKVCNSDALTIGVGVLAAIVGVAAQVLGLTERVKTAASILPQYVAHMHALDRLWAQKSEDGQAIDAAIQAMHQTESVEADKMRDPDDKLMREARAFAEQQVGAAQ